MISPNPMLLEAIAVASVALVVLGAIALLTSVNAGKRLAGVTATLLGAALALAALGAPYIFVTATLAVAFGYLALGALLVIRLQEAYGDTEIPSIDANDDDDERTGNAP